MAKSNGNLSIVEQDRKKQKAKELKKLKQQRNNDKLTRLKQIDPKRLLQRVQALKDKQNRQNGRLIINEQKLLDNLLKDYEVIKKSINPNIDEEIQTKEGEVHEDKDVTTALGSKSVFYDPEWNPTGLAPTGLSNQIYDSSTIIPIDKQSIDINILQIPLPKESKPKFYKIKTNQTTYQSEAQLNNQDITKLIPSSVKHSTNR